MLSLNLTKVLSKQVWLRLQRCLSFVGCLDFYFGPVEVAQQPRRRPSSNLSRRKKTVANGHFSPTQFA